MENRQLKSLISWILFLVTTMSFAHNEKEFTSGNTDPYNTEVRNMLLAMHKQPQPGIDLPDGGYSKGRIAIDSDGNVFAPDDLGAIPWGIGILWSTNHLNDVVHISYNNNPNPDRHANVAKDDPNLTQTEEYRHIMKKTAEIFKLDESIIYDFTIDDQKTKAINSLVTEINKSTASDPLYIVEAGSYYYLYLAFAASDASKHEFVTVISHSMWNDLECHDSNANENILDVLRDFPNVKIDGIVDQNYGSNPQGGTGLRENRNDSWGQIAWMKTSTVPEINWMHTCAEKQDPYRWGFFNNRSQVDVSDAGMYYYLVTGREDAGFGTVKELLLASPVEGKNALYSHTLPTTIPITGTYTFGIEFETNGQPMDIHVDLKLIDPWTSIQNSVQTVSGKGIATISVKLENDLIDGEQYKQIIYMTPVGKSWQETVEGSEYKVDAFASSALNAIPTSAFDKAQKDEVKIYPNPVEDVLTIETAQTMRSIQVVSANGSIMFSEALNASISTVNTASLLPGIYFLIIQTEEGEEITSKVVKL